MLYYVVSVNEIPERRFANFIDVHKSDLGPDDVPLFVTTFLGTHPEFKDDPWFVYQRSTLIGKRSSNNLGGALREANRLPADQREQSVIVTLN